MVFVVGGWFIGEMFVVSIFGFLVEVILLLIVIIIIIDIFNIILNIIGNIVLLMLVLRLVEGKDWFIDKIVIIIKKIS